MNPCKVLLVDDARDFVSALSERLKSRGLEVSIALRGEEALEILADARFDLVILDLNMPGMSGLDVLRQIRSSHPSPAVILLTGQGSTRDGIEGMRLGAFDYLTKPVDIETLMDKMNAVRERK